MVPETKTGTIPASHELGEEVIGEVFGWKVSVDALYNRLADIGRIPYCGTFSDGMLVAIECTPFVLT